MENERRGRRDGVDAAASRAERYRDGVVPRREAHDRRNNVQVFRELCPRLVKEYDVGTLSELVERRRPTPPSPGLVDWEK